MLEEEWSVIQRLLYCCGTYGWSPHLLNSLAEASFSGGGGGGLKPQGSSHSPLSI